MFGPPSVPERAVSKAVRIAGSLLTADFAQILLRVLLQLLDASLATDEHVSVSHANFDRRAVVAERFAGDGADTLS